MFDLKIISKDRRLFEDSVEHVQVEGIDSDFEILSFHADVAGLLKRGRIIVDGKFQIRVRGGLVSFHNNRCVIIVDEDTKRSGAKKSA